MNTQVEGRETGLTLLEILVSLLLLAAVVAANGAVIRALGLLGMVQFSPSRYERPARLRTLAMEYVQAELEYLRNWSYDSFRDANACNPSNGLPTPFPDARRLPPDYLNPDEPRLSGQFTGADILISSEPVISPGTSPTDCRPRRITVSVYLAAADMPPTPGEGGDAIFVRGETVIAPR